MTFIVADRVKETSTTNGTGAMTLAGAMTGFSTFASRCAVGDTLYYAVQAVDAGGAPTGEWECGLGTYSAPNTLTRTTVTSSSNADAAVSFAAGTKQVYITMPAVQAKWARERLTADRTYYVRTDGNDSNTGLVNTAGGAFLTIQKAVDVISGTLDLSIYSCLVQVVAGTYAAAVELKKYLSAGGTVAIKGDETTPANVLISTTNVSCFTGLIGSGVWVLSGVKMHTTTAGAAIRAASGAFIQYKLCDFGACAWAHIYALSGGTVMAIGNYAISGGGFAHWVTENNGYIQCIGYTITVTGTPAFSQSFLATDRGLGVFEIYSITFLGSATGKRYNVVNNSYAFVNGAGANYLPGNVAGTTATGGLYA